MKSAAKRKSHAVHEVRDKTVVVDLHHPRRERPDVKVTDITAAFMHK